ncbi:MAG: nitroreductase family protein [Deltaproteobacteria bacterium]|nr:nitroreductase family protein [Deltaproteobacteria bacterium]
MQTDQAAERAPQIDDQAGERTTPLAHYDRNGVLGQLTGVTLTERDRWLKKTHDELSVRLDAARQAALDSGQSTELDGSALSGTNHGDTWSVLPDGTSVRTLSRFPEVEALIAAWPGLSFPAEGPCGTETLTSLRPLLARCAYDGLWAPSGTNWQPVRAVELSGPELERLANRAQSPVPRGPAGLAFLARTEYESMLGDVAKVARFVLESQAEYIDVGIYALAAELAAAAQGHPTRTVFVHKADQRALTDELACLLEERIPRYADAAMVRRTRELLHMLRTRQYVLDGLFCPPQRPHIPAVPGRLGAPLPTDGLSWSAFDELTATRCSQRVASPTREVSLGELDELWSISLALVEPELRPLLHCASFTWHEPAPRQIGEAMFRGLYGEGAHEETGEGGHGGLISRVTIPSLLAYLEAEGHALPDAIAALGSLEGEALELAAQHAPLPVAFMPRRLREFILSKPQYRDEGGYLVGRTGEPLTVGQFIRMVRLLALSFGRFFLSFQNTHPVTAIILATRVEDADLHARVYRAVGRMMASLTFLCRARGLVSIIKGGPTEINRPGIGHVAAEHSRDPEVRRLMTEERALASLTFQVGHPLGPDELVKVRDKHHTGLAERGFDKRSPRAPLAHHYFPWA